MANSSTDIKHLAKAIFQFNSNPGLMEKHPEVLDGNFINIKK